MVEKYDTGGVHNFGIDVTERVLTELYYLFRLVLITNELQSGRRLVHITQHLQRDEVVVGHHLVGCVLNVNTKQVLEDGHVKRLPMLVIDVSCRRLVWEQQPDQIHKADLGFVFGHFKHLNEFVDGLLWYALKIEDVNPFLELLNLTDLFLDGLRFGKLEDDFFHLLDIALGVKGLRRHVRRLELFERNLAVVLCFDYFSLWDLVAQFSHQGEKLGFASTSEHLVLLAIQEGDEGWVSFNLVGHDGVTGFVTVARCKYEIFVFV